MKTNTERTNVMAGMQVGNVNWAFGALIRCKGADIEEGTNTPPELTLPEVVSIDNLEPLNVDEVEATDESIYSVSRTWNFQNIKDTLSAPPLSYNNIPNTGVIVTKVVNEETGETKRVLTFPNAAAPHNYGVKGTEGEIVTIDNLEPLNVDEVEATDESIYSVSRTWNFQNIKDTLSAPPLSYNNIPNTGVIVTKVVNEETGETKRVLTFPNAAAPHNYGVKGADVNENNVAETEGTNGDTPPTLTLPEVVSIDNLEPLNVDEVEATDESIYSVSRTWNFQNIKDTLSAPPLSYNNIPNTGVIVTKVVNEETGETKRVLTFPNAAAPHNYGVKGAEGEIVTIDNLEPLNVDEVEATDESIYSVSRTWNFQNIKDTLSAPPLSYNNIPNTGVIVTKVVNEETGETKRVLTFPNAAAPHNYGVKGTEGEIVTIDNLEPLNVDEVEATDESIYSVSRTWNFQNIKDTLSAPPLSYNNIPNTGVIVTKVVNEETGETKRVLTFPNAAAPHNYGVKG